MTYKYRFLTRPASTFACPRENFISLHQDHEFRKFGVVEYSAPLEIEEAKHYDLAPLFLGHYEGKTVNFYHDHSGTISLTNNANSGQLFFSIYHEGEKLQTLVWWNFLDKLQACEFIIDPEPAQAPAPPEVAPIPEDRRVKTMSGGHKVVYLTPGDIVKMKIGHSEAAQFTRIAGTVQTVQILNYHMAQIVDPETRRPIGGAYTTGELGIYGNAACLYIHAEDLQEPVNNLRAEMYGDEKILTDGRDQIIHL